MLGGLNLSSADRRLHFYPLDELAKFRSVHGRLAKEYDLDIPETGCVDSSHQVIQVLAGPPIFEVCESRKDNAFPWRRRQVREAPAAGEGK